MSLLMDEPLDGSPSSRSTTVDLPTDQPAIQSHGRPSRIRYRALAWLTAAAALAYLCRHAISVPESAIRGELGLTLDQAGLLQGAFFWTYAIFQVPGGWIAERFGTRISLTIFAISWSVATLAIGLAPALWMLVVAQLIMGTAQAGLLPAAYNSIGHWMPVSQRALGCGVLAAGMQIGAIAASALAARWMEPLGWRAIFIAFAVPGMLWAVSFYFWFRDRPSEVSSVNSGELAIILAGREREELTTDLVPSEATELLGITRNPIMWWLCGQQICRAAGYSFFVSWLPTFLQQTRGMSIGSSGYMQGAILAAMLPGTILSGVLTDWIWRRTGDLRLSRSGVAVASLSVCAISFLGAWLTPVAELAVGLLAIGGFFAALGGPCAFAAAIDIAGPRVPQVVGVMNMTGNFAAAACPLLVAKLFKLNEGNWNLVLLLFAGIYLGAAICWMFVNPRRRLR